MTDDPIVPFLIAGLGNPGRRYAGTRHNVGFDLVERIASDRKVSFAAGRSDGHSYRLAKTRFGETEILLLEPLTYMNRSGLVIAPVAESHDIPPERCLVVVDDMALPVGKIRFRARGSAGGHNGLTSVEEALGTQDYLRLRVGIGPQPASEEWADFVTMPFEGDERKTVDEAIERAIEGIVTLVADGVERTMSLYNG